MEKKVLIVGAGFAGVSAALNLAKQKIPRLKIVLVSPTPHFEYHATLYRVLAGHSPLEVCVPLHEIFKGTEVEVLEDEITDVNFEGKTATGTSESKYKFDYLVLALGSETAYFDIPGLKKLSYSLKSITDVIRLNRHLHQSFLECTFVKDKSDKMCNTHIVIVGGGATGVEVAGELSAYSKLLAKKHFIDPSLITIDLITSPDRLLNDQPAEISTMVESRLRSLGVNLYLKKRVLREEVETVYLKDIEMKTKTVIWAAGVAGNHRYQEWGLPVDEKGKVIVDEYLHPKINDELLISNSSNQALNPESSRRLGQLDQLEIRNFKNVFIIGDGAATKYSGVANTALQDGKQVAENILGDLSGKAMMRYVSQASSTYVPVGPGWAIARKGSQVVTGKLGWFFRRLHDFKFFLSILPFNKALDAFRSDKILWESCPICSKK